MVRIINGSSNYDKDDTMKKKRKTWEIILAGLALTALSIYVIFPVQRNVTPSSKQNIEIKIGNQDFHITFDQPVNAEEAKQIEEQLKEAKEQIKKAAKELDGLSFPSIDHFPDISLDTNL